MRRLANAGLEATKHSVREVYLVDDLEYQNRIHSEIVRKIQDVTPKYSADSLPCYTAFKGIVVSLVKYSRSGREIIQLGTFLSRYPPIIQVSSVNHVFFLYYRHIS